MRNVILIFISCMFLFSCVFNGIPGQQISSSIAKAKENGTFLCSYKIKDNTLNGVEIKDIFIEKQYYLAEGVFSKYEIDNTKSQLIIRSKDVGGDQIHQYDITWKVTGFEERYTLVIHKSFNRVSLPDKIPIKVVAIKENDTTQVIENDTLYKVQK